MFVKHVLSIFRIFPVWSDIFMHFSLTNDNRIGYRSMLNCVNALEPAPPQQGPGTEQAALMVAAEDKSHQDSCKNY